MMRSMTSTLSMTSRPIPGTKILAFISFSGLSFLILLFGFIGTTVASSSSGIHFMQTIHKMSWPNGFWGGNSNHVMSRMQTFSLTKATKVKIRTNHTFVPKSLHWTIASITRNSIVDFSILFLVFLASIFVSGMMIWIKVCFRFDHLQFVNRSDQFLKSDQQFLISFDGDVIVVFILPGYFAVGTAQIENGTDFFLEVNQR